MSPAQKKRRWLRLAIPFAVLIAFWVSSTIFHEIQQPDLDDPGTLSPTGTGEHGSSHLADLLRARNVTIERVTSSQAALQSAAATDSTVFVPTPGYLEPTFFADVSTVAGAHRVVVVQPSLFTALFAGLPVIPGGSRWATRSARPGCQEPYATAAGAAAVYHDRYLVEPEQGVIVCYQGAMATVRNDDDELVYVGATDPFRNDRITEVGNAALATALLSEHRHVIWVDVHTSEFNVSLNAPRMKLPQYRRGDRDRTQTGFPVIDAFPPWLWAGLLLLLVSAVLYALARARRLGPPVSEPLPVLVPAAEAVTGRGRLYERIGAREATVDALRGAAITRIARVVNPFGRPGSERELLTAGPAADALVQQLAERTGRSPDSIAAILYGPTPTDDAGLAQAVADLDALVDTVLHNHSMDSSQGGTP